MSSVVGSAEQRDMRASFAALTDMAWAVVHCGNMTECSWKGKEGVYKQRKCVVVMRRDDEKEDGG
jgi:hypothetical protein